MSDVMEFGFDDAKVIKNQGIEQFKLSRTGEKARIAIISFKKFHDVALAGKAREKGSPLTDEEKAGYISKIDSKLAETLKKEVKDLTEADRLDIKQPRFAFAFTHFGEGVGTIRCLSKYEGTTCVNPELCCNKFGDAEQSVATVILKYPTDSDGNVDVELLKLRKYTSVEIWKMSSKKYKNLESAYVDARNDKRYVIDLRVQLEGDPKYKNIKVEAGSGATWARDDMDPAVRAWVLDQGLRAWKYIPNNLGFEMTKDKLIEKLNGGSSSNSQMDASSHAEAPKLVASYDELLK